MKVKWGNASKMPDNKNTNQNGFSFCTKVVEIILDYSFFVSIILNY